MRRLGLLGAWIRSILVGPTGLVLFLLGLYLLALWFWHRRTKQPVRVSAAWGIGASAVFLFLCLPYPAVLLDLPLEWWGRRLERAHPVQTPIPADTARRTVVLVLGASLTDSGTLSTESLNRAECARKVWRRMPDAWFLFSDGGIARYHVEKQVRTYLQRCGIPGDRILLETHSRSTQENIKLTLPLLRAHGIEHVVLVTARRHLPRGYLVCRRYGLRPRVYGCYFPPPLAFCPTWSNLKFFSSVLNEYVGLLGYKLLGWA